MSILQAIKQCVLSMLVGFRVELEGKGSPVVAKVFLFFFFLPAKLASTFLLLLNVRASLLTLLLWRSGSGKMSPKQKINGERELVKGEKKKIYVASLTGPFRKCSWCTFS